jgi:hypothetical protein
VVVVVVVMMMITEHVETVSHAATGLYTTCSGKVAAGSMYVHRLRAGCGLARSPR